jgi:hypothetical protein
MILEFEYHICIQYQDLFPEPTGLNQLGRMAAFGSA